MVSKEEDCAVTEVLQENAVKSAAPKRRTHRGKGSRVRRLEQFQQDRVDESLQSAVPWARMAYTLLRKDRANLRERVGEAWVRVRTTRAKIRKAVWHRWTERWMLRDDPKGGCQHCLHEHGGGYEYCLVPYGSGYRDSWDATSDGCYYIQGEKLEPLSLRDLYILIKTTVFMKQLNMDDPDHELADQEGHRYYRTTQDWLREPTDDGRHHWKRTERENDAAYEFAAHVAEYGENCVCERCDLWPHLFDEYVSDKDATRF